MSLVFAQVIDDDIIYLFVPVSATLTVSIHLLPGKVAAVVVVAKVVVVVA